MQAPSGKDEACDFGRTIHLARAKAFAVATHGRPAVVVLAVERHGRLRASLAAVAALIE